MAAQPSPFQTLDVAVVIEIASYLGQQDLASTIKSCTLWHAVCQPMLFTNVTLRQNTSKSFVQQIQRNRPLGSLVRSISFVYRDRCADDDMAKLFPHMPELRHWHSDAPGIGDLPRELRSSKIVPSICDKLSSLLRSARSERSTVLKRLQSCVLEQTNAAAPGLCLGSRAELFTLRSLRKLTIMIPTLFDDCGGILLQAHKEGFQRTTDLEELNLCTYRLLPKTLKLMLSFPQSLKKLRLIEVCQGFKESYPNEDLGSTVYMGAIFQQRLSLEEVYIHNVGGGRLGCGFGLCPQLRVLSIDAFTLFGARLLNRHGDMMDPNHQTVPTFAYFLPRSLEHLTLFYETSPDLARGPWFMPDYGLNFLLYALAAQKRERVPRLRTVTLTAVSREVIPEPEPAPVEDFFEFDEVWVGFVWNMIIIEPSPVERPE